MGTIPAVQVTDTYEKLSDALEALKFAYAQVGSMGGRVYRYETKYKLQAFFEPPDPAHRGLLPDGCRMVEVPHRMLTCQIHRLSRA